MGGVPSSNGGFLGFEGDHERGSGNKDLDLSLNAQIMRSWMICLYRVLRLDWGVLMLNTTLRVVTMEVYETPNPALSLLSRVRSNHKDWESTQ